MSFETFTPIWSHMLAKNEKKIAENPKFEMPSFFEYVSGNCGLKYDEVI